MNNTLSHSPSMPQKATEMYGLHFLELISQPMGGRRQQQDKLSNELTYSPKITRVVKLLCFQIANTINIALVYTSSVVRQLFGLKTCCQMRIMPSLAAHEYLFFPSSLELSAAIMLFIPNTFQDCKYEFSVQTMSNLQAITDLLR